jgi:hypothetical protein
VKDRQIEIRELNPAGPELSDAELGAARGGICLDWCCFGDSTCTAGGYDSDNNIWETTC